MRRAYVNEDREYERAIGEYDEYLGLKDYEVQYLKYLRRLAREKDDYASEFGDFV